MSEVAFLLNGTPVRLRNVAPTRTLLDWLREERGLTGTKEGCNEGDCGACSVVVGDADGLRALNACILFLPQLHGKTLRTVEGFAENGALHPVQQEMVRHHGSQCGFCTPGFVASMVAGHACGARDHDVVLAGNLCRCTGYAPIIRAAKAAEDAPLPGWIAADRGFQLPVAAPAPEGSPEAVTEPALMPAGPGYVMPQSSDQLAAWYAKNPDARLVAGATDIGLWVTKGLKDPGPMAFIAGIRDLQGVTVRDGEIRIGAATTISALRREIAPFYKSFADMLTRYASTQVRNAATIGGNIGNGSPIGDGPPALIALDAVLHLRCGDARRSLALAEYFLEYGRQDRRPGEFIEAVTIPAQPDYLRVYKLSKRFDQDISAVLGAFHITVHDGHVTRARVAFGGMAGTPKRAPACEAVLTGADWSAATITRAAEALTQDFTPLSDMRASADYRMQAARGMLARLWAESQGEKSNILEVRA